MTVTVPPDANSPFLDDKGKLTQRSRDWANQVSKETSDEEWTDVTFENSWVNFSATFNDCQFRLLGSERVELRGMVKDGVAGGSTAIFTFPIGLRPLRRYVFTTTSSGALGRVDIFSDGMVAVTVGTNTFVNLDGIIFSLD